MNDLTLKDCEGFNCEQWEITFEHIAKAYEKSRKSQEKPIEEWYSSNFRAALLLARG